jgi:hypothetical protein
MPLDALGGFSAFGSWCDLNGEEMAPVSNRKKTDPEFVPKVIEANSDDDPHFFACVPHQIKSDWDEKWGPLLEGFPLNILFAGIRKDGPTTTSSLVEVCYWPHVVTFRENSNRKELVYLTDPVNSFSVRVIFIKSTGEWQTERFRGKRLIRSAFGSTFEQVMIHTTMGGPEPDER